MKDSAPGGCTPAALPEGRRIETNGIELVVHEAGSGPVVVLLHGFPELAYSWRYQIAHLVAEGYRVIAPDQRGYGGSDAPVDPHAYSVRTLVNDAIGILDALDIDKAVFVGHDFGAKVAWHAGVYAPERTAAIAGICTPHVPRGHCDVVEANRRRHGPNHYMSTFQRPGVAEDLFERDVEGTFRALMRRPGLTLAELKDVPRVQQLPAEILVGDPQVLGEPLLSDAELAVYVNTFRRSGFEGPLNWYRSLHLTWQECAGVDLRLHQPALMISGADDVFLPPTVTDGMEALVPQLERRVIDRCGHWTQQERPRHVNSILTEFLRSRPVVSALASSRH